MLNPIITLFFEVFAFFLSILCITPLTFLTLRHTQLSVSFSCIQLFYPFNHRDPICQVECAVGAGEVAV